MTQYGSKDASLKYNSQDMSSLISRTMPTVDQTAETADATPMGSNVARQAYTGLTTYGDITIAGPYDDTASTGSDAVFGAACRARSLYTLEVAWGGSKKVSITNVGVKNYKRIVARGGFTEYEATLFLGPGSAVTET